MLKRIASLSLVGLVGLAGLAACTGGVSLGKSPAASTADDGSTASGPYGITCTGYWRANGNSEFVEQKFAVRSDATGAQTLRWDGSKTTGASTLAFNYATAADRADQADLTVTSSEIGATQVFRLSKTRRPAAQMLGDQGFTGLLYIGPYVQYICSADGATPPASTASVVPLDAVCQVELRSEPGGVVERRETYALRTPTTAQFETQTFTQDDVTVTIMLSDDPFDARSIVVNARKGTDANTTSIQQLFQIDRKATLYNQLAGTTFSGRVTLGTTGKEVSYACSARTSTSTNTECPVVADSCGAGCLPLYGSRYDPVRDCRYAATSVVSCGKGLVGGTTDAPCLVRSDGVVLMGSGSLTSTGAFTRCDEALNKRANEATAICPADTTDQSCTNGPARDPYVSLPLRTWESTLPSTPCPTRCNDTSKAYWGAGGGPSPTLSALPTGACSNLPNNVSNSCAAAAVQLHCPAQTGPNLQGTLFDVECICQYNNWNCYGVYKAGGPTPPCQ